MQYSMNGGYGRMLATQIAAAVGPVFGKINVVVSASETDYKKRMMSEIFTPDVDGRVRFFATLEAAYDACLTNEDDIILLAGYAVHDLAAGIAWSKSRIHVLGMDGGGRLTDQGAKVRLPGVSATAYVLSVTGTRNTFQNIKFIQGSTAGTALTVAQMGGEGNRYTNCSFVFEVADNLGSTSAYEIICGEDSGTFINCEFGADTLVSTVARSVMLLKAVTAGQPFKSNRFRDCTWKSSSSSAGQCMIKVDSTAAVNFINIFERPVFAANVCVAAGAVAMTSAIISITGLNAGTLNFAYPSGFNITDYAAAGSNANAAVQVIAPVVSVNSNVGVAPTA